MSNTPPPPGPGGQSLPPDPNPDTLTPSGTGSGQEPTQPSSPPPTTPPPGTGEDAPAGMAHEVTDPNLGAGEPTVADGPSPSDAAATAQDDAHGPFQSEIKPGSPYPTEPPPGAPVEPTVAAGFAEQGQSGDQVGHDQVGHDQQPGQVRLGGYEIPSGQGGDMDGGDLPPYGPDRFGYPDHHPAQPNKANAALIGLIGILTAIILAGGGYIWFAQNQAAKTSSERALEAAQSEARVAQAEAQKAQEQARKAQEEANRQAEEAARKASEAAAKAAATTQPAAPPPPAAPAAPAPPPAVPAPARPAPAPAAPAKDRGTPLGNGCTPGDKPLTDGIWYAYVWDEDDGIVAFDLVCYYEDGSVTNDNKKIRTLPTSTGWDPEGGLIGFEVSGGVIVDMWHI